MSLNYQLGLLAGSIIYEKYLPTLSTDMLQSNVIIKVSEEDTLEQERFQKLYDSALNDTERYWKIHREWMEFYTPMSKKYLPKTIECKIEKIKPTNIEQFKKGLNDYLWNTDLSHYLADDGFFLPNVKYAWCSTIILTRVDI